jgi:hypothetical protein
MEVAVPELLSILVVARLRRGVIGRSPAQQKSQKEVRYRMGGRESWR